MIWVLSALPEKRLKKNEEKFGKRPKGERTTLYIEIWKGRQSLSTKKKQNKMKNKTSINLNIPGGKTQEQLDWESEIYPTYLWRYTKLGDIAIRPSVDTTYGSAYLTPTYIKGLVSFVLESPNGLDIPDNHLELITEYLSQKEEIQWKNSFRQVRTHYTQNIVYTGIWNEINTKQLNREKKLSFILG